MVDFALMRAGVGHPAEQAGAERFHLPDGLFARFAAGACVLGAGQIGGDLGKGAAGGAIALGQALHLAAQDGHTDVLRPPPPATHTHTRAYFARAHAFPG